MAATSPVGWSTARMPTNSRTVLANYTAHVGEKYEGLKGTPMVFAVGDGNHSLATAKSCYEELKAQNPGVDLSNHPARFALVELENIHDEAQVFEPIHRVVAGTDPKKLLAELQATLVRRGRLPRQVVHRRARAARSTSTRQRASWPSARCRASWMRI